MIQLIYLTVLLPFAGFLINGFLGSKIKNVERSEIPFIGEKIIGAIGCGVIGLSFLISLGALFETIALPVEGRKNIVEFFTWLSVGGLHINIAYQVDQLSLIMSLIVTGVGFIIHIYSIGYMHGDKSF